MPSSILDGLALIDATGRLILATTIGTLVLGVAASFAARARYSRLERDLEENGASGRFAHTLLNDIVRAARDTARRGPEASTQVIVEEQFHTGLKPLLLAERFVRAATGLVIILGLLGTFYGLTSSIGKLVHLVADDAGGATDAMQGVTAGLTQALSGMAVAFSNSLVGILSAVILTVLGVFSNLADHRVAVMTRIEAYLDRLLADGTHASANTPGGLERAAAGFGASVQRLDDVVARFEAALNAFSSSTHEFNQFNAHLKDNVQRMSLSFGDLSDTLRTQAAALKRGNGQ